MHMRALTFLLSSALSLAYARSSSLTVRTLDTSNSSLISPEVSAYAQSFIDNNLTPGLTVAVVQLDNTSYTADFGSWGNRTEDGDLAQPDTLFAIGSISKAFLATALGILMEDYANGHNVTALPAGLSEFTFDTKMLALLPDVWKLEDEFAWQKSSVRDLLSHVTGITRNDFMYAYTDTPLGLGERFQYIHPGYELREEYLYTNVMYLFLPYVISTYSGKTFQEFVNERIFTPLNMTSTTYNFTAAEETGKMSQSWIYTGRRIPIAFESEAASNFVAGAGGIVSSAIDMAKWAATMLNGGVNPVTNVTVIPDWVFDDTTTVRAIVSGNTTDDPTISIIGYGLGWQRQSYLGHDIITHDGGIPGFVSRLIILPRENLAVVALLNTDGPWQDLVPLAVIDSVLGLNVTPTLPSSTSISSSASTPAANTSCTPSVPIERFAGNYTSLGYGNITFCAPSTGTGTNESTTTYCAEALYDWASISLNGTLAPNALYAMTPRLATHAVMQYVCPDEDQTSKNGTAQFVVTLRSIYANGYGRNTTPFYEDASIVFPEIDVECLMNEQAGVIGCGWLNLEPGHKRTGSVQERADAWWAKV